MGRGCRSPTWWRLGLLETSPSFAADLLEFGYVEICRTTLDGKKVQSQQSNVCGHYRASATLSESYVVEVWTLENIPWICIWFCENSDTWKFVGQVGWQKSPGATGRTFADTIGQCVVDALRTE